MDDTTFFDQRPTHPRRDLVLVALRQRAHEAWAEYLAAIDLGADLTGPLEAAIEADALVSQRYAELNSPVQTEETQDVS